MCLPCPPRGGANDLEECLGSRVIGSGFEYNGILVLIIWLCSSVLLLS